MAVRRYRLEVLLDIDTDAFITPVDTQQFLYIKEQLLEALGELDGVSVRAASLRGQNSR